MPNNLHGDIPTEHIELAKELEEIEQFFDSRVNFYPSSIIAKGFVCVSFDWYAMGDEDKGALLLEKAEKVCPGYFNNQIYTHMSESSDFNILVKELTHNILELFKEELR